MPPRRTTRSGAALPAVDDNMEEDTGDVIPPMPDNFMASGVRAVRQGFWDSTPPAVREDYLANFDGAALEDTAGAVSGVRVLANLTSMKAFMANSEELRGAVESSLAANCEVMAERLRHMLGINNNAQVPESPGHFAVKF